MLSCAAQAHAAAGCNGRQAATAAVGVGSRPAHASRAPCQLLFSQPAQRMVINVGEGHGSLLVAQPALPTNAGVSFITDEGLNLRHFTMGELAFLYREIFQERVYMQHRVHLKPGDTVLDVGANAGLFTLLACQEVGPSGRVISLEPLPATFGLLQANVSAHQQWCAQRGVPVCVPVLLQCGAGASNGEASFTMYSDSATGWSSMYPDDGELRSNMERYIENTMSAGWEASSSDTSQQPLPQRGPPDSTPQEALGRLLWRVPALRPLVRAAGRLEVSRMMSGRTQVRCRLRRLADVLAEQGLQQVDLLKVDVERCELDVLQGLMADPDAEPSAGSSRSMLASVRQVVLEVHDGPLGDDAPAGAGSAAAHGTGGRLAAVQVLLRAHGLTHIAVEQDARLKGTNLFTVYATR